MPLGLVTPGAWTREQALAAAAKSRLVRREQARLRRLRRSRLESLALDPPAALPALLRDQIAGASLHLESAQREGKTKQLKEWIQIVRRLVELERFVSSPPSTRSSATSPAKFLPPPSPPSPPTSGPGPAGASTPPAPPPKDQVDQVEPFPTEPLD